MMVAVLLFVLELRDRLVLTDLLGPLARAAQIRFPRMFGADSHLRQQLRQLTAPALRAFGRRIASTHQRFEFMSAVLALVFVERHKRSCGSNMRRGPLWPAKGTPPAPYAGRYHMVVHAVLLVLIAGLAGACRQAH